MKNPELRGSFFYFYGQLRHSLSSAKYLERQMSGETPEPDRTGHEAASLAVEENLPICKAQKGDKKMEKIITEEEFEKEAREGWDDYRCFAESYMNRMRAAWNRYDAAMREGRDEEIDDDYFFAQDVLKELGIDYECHSQRFYVEGPDCRAAIENEELETVDWVYAHGELNNLAGYDIVDRLKVKPFDNKSDRIEDVYAILPDGREIPSHLYFWLDKKSFAHGLIVSRLDKEANEYAKNAYERKARYI